MTFHITLEIYAELCAQAAAVGGDGGEEGRVERGRDDEGTGNGRKRGQKCADRYSSTKTPGFDWNLLYIYSTSIHVNIDSLRPLKGHKLSPMIY